MALDLLQLEDDAVAKLYGDRIEPALRAREAERSTGVATFYRRMGWGVLVAAMCAALMLGYFESPIEPTLIVCALLLVGAYILAISPLQELEAEVKQKTLHAIAEATGCNYKMNGFKPKAFQRFVDLPLLRDSDRQTFQDRFTGTHHGCQFSFCDAHLERRSGSKDRKSWETVFQGQLIQVEFPKEFLGITIVQRDAGFLNALRGRALGLQRVGLGDARLEKAFEVHASDQVEARYLIHPVFMERLLELETLFEGQRLRCAFERGDLLLAVEGGDKFEMGSMFARLDDIARVRAIVADLAGIVRLIDAVLTAEQSALPRT